MELEVNPLVDESVYAILRLAVECLFQDLLVRCLILLRFLELLHLLHHSLVHHRLVYG